MALLPILSWPDTRLTTACEKVEEIDDSIRTLAEDMLETMYDAPGRGLAAPQVGRTIRMFVMDAFWKDNTRSPLVMVNPEILWRSPQTVEMDEGCLSIPGITTTISRPERITIRWTNLNGGEVEVTMTGISARVAQHEADHLDGIVTFDRLDPETRVMAQQKYEMARS